MGPSAPWPLRCRIATPEAKMGALASVCLARATAERTSSVAPRKWTVRSGGPKGMGPRGRGGDAWSPRSACRTRTTTSGQSVPLPPHRLSPPRLPQPRLPPPWLPPPRLPPPWLTLVGLLWSFFGDPDCQCPRGGAPQYTCDNSVTPSMCYYDGLY